MQDRELIKCALCRFVREDKSMSERAWKAYECGNAKSEYYRCLLNISRDGNMMPSVKWHGCSCGQKKWCCK